MSRLEGNQEWSSGPPRERMKRRCERRREQQHTLETPDPPWSAPKPDQRPLSPLTCIYAILLISCPIVFYYVYIGFVTFIYIDWILLG